jgi:hypothetical protein
MAKTFNDWLFDLDEHLGARGVPVRSGGFDRAALDFGFANGLTPEEFLSHPCSLREQVTEPIQVDRPEDLRPRRSPVVGVIVGFVVVLLLAIGVPRILRAGHHLSGRHLQTARHAVDALQKLEAKAKPGAELEAYSSQVADAQEAVATLSAGFGHDSLEGKLSSALKHYVFAEELWRSNLDEPSPSKELPSVNAFWQNYPDGHIWFMGDSLLSITPALNVVWAEARKELAAAVELL